MSKMQVFGLVALAGEIRARESLEFINNVASVFDEDGAKYRTRLAEIAFNDDPDVAVAVIESLGRSRRKD